MLSYMDDKQIMYSRQIIYSGTLFMCRVGTIKTKTAIFALSFTTALH